MAKNTKIEKVSGKVENTIPIELDVYAGFTCQESVAAIKNPAMRKQVVQFAKAVMIEIDSKWKQAIAVAGMTIEMRKEFGNDSAVANFLGMTRGQFSKLQRAGKFAIEYKKTHATLPRYSVFTEALPLESEAYGKQDLTIAIEHIEENELTQAETREYVKSFKKPSEKASKKDKKDEKQAEKTATDGQENGSLTKQEESEERWINAVQITEEAAKLLVEAKADLHNTIVGLLAEYGIIEDDVRIMF